MQSIFAEKKNYFPLIDTVELSDVWQGNHRRYSVLQNIEGENGRNKRTPLIWGGADDSISLADGMSRVGK